MVFSSAFSLLIFWNGFIMIFHDINLLHHAVELDCLSAFIISTGLGFLVFKWLLRGVLFGVFLKHFLLFVRVNKDIQHKCIFCTSERIARVACIFSLTLSRAALLGVGWKGGSY